MVGEVAPDDTSAIADTARHHRCRSQKQAGVLDAAGTQNDGLGPYTCGSSVKAPQIERCDATATLVKMDRRDRGMRQDLDVRRHQLGSHIGKSHGLAVPITLMAELPEERAKEIAVETEFVRRRVQPAKEPLVIEIGSEIEQARRAIKPRRQAFARHRPTGDRQPGPALQVDFVEARAFADPGMRAAAEHPVAQLERGMSFSHSRLPL